MQIPGPPRMRTAVPGPTAQGGQGHSQGHVGDAGSRSHTECCRGVHEGPLHPPVPMCARGALAGGHTICPALSLTHSHACPRHWHLA